MATIAERIKKALELQNMKQADLVEKTGIGKSSISTYISGEYEPKQRNIYKLAKALNVNESWLMGYDVPIYRNYIPGQDYGTFTPKTMELLKNFGKLNDIGQHEASKRVEELTCIDKYVKEVKADKKELPDYLQPVAAHNDNLDEEQQEKMFRDIEKIKNKKKNI